MPPSFFSDFIIVSKSAQRKDAIYLNLRPYLLISVILAFFFAHFTKMNQLFCTKSRLYSFGLIPYFSRNFL